MTAYDIAAKLPSIDVLRDRCRALAVLERIIDGGEPYYAYTRSWGDDEAALMDNGSGDEWTIVFTAGGAFIRLFDHESPMSPYRDPDHEPWPGLLDGIPELFRPQLNEPAFADEEGQFLATAVLWRLTDDDRWHTGDGITFPTTGSPHSGTTPDGTHLLDILLDDITGQYIAFANDYYETDLDHTAVDHIIAQRPLTNAVVQTLNPEATLARLHTDTTAIGYPIATP